MTPNIFHANAIPGSEDRFSAHWHYLLDTHHELGQRVLDRIASWSGLPQTTYVESEDHPWYSREDRPDFRIHGVDYDVVCEHKLDAALGVAQLERYCKLAQASERPTYAILIGKSPVAVPAEVRNSPQYRRPVAAPNAIARDHFLWEDFYPLVEETEGRLAGDFLSYMGALGLEPWSWGDIGDPTQAGPALDQFRRLWLEILPPYRRRGVVAKVDPVGPGFQYQRPMSGIHHIWCGPSRTLEAPADPRAPGRVLVLRVWQSADGLDGASSLFANATTDTISADHGGVATFIRRPMKFGRSYGMLTREYYTPLTGILSGTWQDAGQKLAQWLKVVMEHLSVDAEAMANGDREPSPDDHALPHA